MVLCVNMFFFFKQKTAYEMRISDWSSDVCSSDLCCGTRPRASGRQSEGCGNRDIGLCLYGGSISPNPMARSALWAFLPCGTAPCRLCICWHWNQIGRASCRERVCQYV